MFARLLLASRSSIAALLFVPALIAIVLVIAPPAVAEKLQITSNPPGATVSLDGVAEGVTPFEKDYPGGFFHRTHTSFASRLEHAMVARVSLAGYASKEFTLTEGPMNWVGLNGRNHGEYFLLKTDHFHVNLDPVAGVFTGTISERGPQGVNGGSAMPASLSPMPASAANGPAVSG